MCIWSHVLRVPFATKLREIIDTHNLDRLEIAEESLICLTNLKDLQELKGEDQIKQFIVKSKFENIMGETESADFLATQSLEDKLEFAHQLVQLSLLTGLNDVHLQNMGIDRESGKLVIFDTEPIYGAMYLEGEEIKEIHLKKMLNNIMIPQCFPEYYEVLNSYMNDF